MSIRRHIVSKRRGEPNRRFCKSERCYKTNKICHLTEREAKRHRCFLASDVGCDLALISVFVCEFCQHFHVGNEEYETKLEYVGRKRKGMKH